jgi:hypothetical protein
MVFVGLVGFIFVAWSCNHWNPNVIIAIIGIPTSLLQNNDEGILDQGKSR